jgi:hypothetical protein
MKHGSGSKAMPAISIILFISICFTGSYLLSRSIQLNNNDLLLTYETLKPVSYSEEKVGNSIYRDYYFGEETGRTIVENDGLEITIRDDKHGFIKSYFYGVLYYIDDIKKDKSFGEIKSYLNPKFWFGGGREIALSGAKRIRTADECQKIGQLLKEKRYDQITEDKKNKIIITDKGTYFVN